jgi:hypothetical protein
VRVIGRPDTDAVRPGCEAKPNWLLFFLSFTTGSARRCGGGHRRHVHGWIEEEHAQCLGTAENSWHRAVRMPGRSALEQNHDAMWACAHRLARARRVLVWRLLSACQPFSNELRISFAPREPAVPSVFFCAVVGPRAASWHQPCASSARLALAAGTRTIYE